MLCTTLFFNQARFLSCAFLINSPVLCNNQQYFLLSVHLHVGKFLLRGGTCRGLETIVGIVLFSVFESWILKLAGWARRHLSLVGQGVRSVLCCHLACQVVFHEIQTVCLVCTVLVELLSVVRTILLLFVEAFRLRLLLPVPCA